MVGFLMPLLMLNINTDAFHLWYTRPTLDWTHLGDSELEIGESSGKPGYQKFELQE